MQNYLFVRFAKPSQSGFLSYSDITGLGSLLRLATYEWSYLYAFVCPETGEGHYWLIPEVTLPTYQKVIEAFARNVGAGLTA